MAELGWPTSEVMQEHLQNLVSQGYMIVVELATYRVREASVSPAPAGDTSWCARHSTNGDLVCHHIDFSAPCYGPKGCSCIT
jgi:hypothetical protein